MSIPTKYASLYIKIDITKLYYLPNMQPQKTLTFDYMMANRELLENLIKRRFVYTPAFEIYGRRAGLYDYGPIGCAIANNLEQFWREHFIMEEDALEIRGTCLTPARVFQASGHVSRFTDLMVRDVKTNQGIRASRLLTDFLTTKLRNPDEKLTEQQKKQLQKYLISADIYNQEDMARVFSKLNVKAPTGNQVTKPELFSLMFQTNIGPDEDLEGFLRPEAAQGIFVNFRKLLEYNEGRMPFAAAQIGLGFRNQIAPRNGLTRAREFTLLEMEYFVDPEDKSHPKFSQCRWVQLPLFSQINQRAEKGVVWIQIDQAVDQKLVHNQTLGYFLARIYLFLAFAGVNKDCMRFRQLSVQERGGYYSQDRWDCEVLTSFGWARCVRTTDGFASDLLKHSQTTGQKLLVSRAVNFKDQTAVNIINKGAAETNNKHLQMLISHLDNMNEESKNDLMEELNKKVQKQLTLGSVTFRMAKDSTSFKVNSIQQRYVPHVVQSSFDLGRIIYAILEHSFRIRTDKDGNQDQKRTFLALPPKIAPIKVSLIPIVSSPAIDPYVKDLQKSLKKNLISCKIDDSAQAIGRRYARTDQVGIPFAITIDFETLKSQTVTLREVLSRKQVRILIAEVARIVPGLVEGLIDWSDVLTKYSVSTSEDG